MKTQGPSVYKGVYRSNPQHTRRPLPGDHKLRPGRKMSPKPLFERLRAFKAFVVFACASGSCGRVTWGVKLFRTSHRKSRVLTDRCQLADQLAHGHFTMR